MTPGRIQARLLVRVPIAPVPEHFGDCKDPQRAVREFLALAQGPVEFRVEKVRTFVDESKAGEALDAMMSEFESGMDYLTNPKFAGAFVRKKFEEMRKAEQTSKLHREAVRRAEAP